jgi:hypothetical protein
MPGMSRAWSILNAELQLADRDSKAVVIFLRAGFSVCFTKTTALALPAYVRPVLLTDPGDAQYTARAGLTSCSLK